MRETAIQAYPNPYSRKMVANHPHQTPQQGDCAHRRRHVARAQHGGAEILFGFVVEADKTHHREVAPGVVVSIEER